MIKQANLESQNTSTSIPPELARSTAYWKSLKSYTSPSLLNDCSTWWRKLSADVNVWPVTVLRYSLLTVQPSRTVVERRREHLSDGVSCWQSSDRGYSWLDVVGFLKLLYVSRSCAVAWFWLDALSTTRDFQTHSCDFFRVKLSSLSV